MLLNTRTSGILLHPTSLASLFPIGDLGPAAQKFADFLSRSGQRWWQMLPIGPAGEEHSPYTALSAFAGNPLLISPEVLVAKGLLDRRDMDTPKPQRLDRVDYPAAEHLKTQWLQKAFQNFDQAADSRNRSALENFANAESGWLDDFTLFSAIRGRAKTADWTRWNQDLKTRNPSALARAKKELAREIRYHQFVQWEYSLQWQKLKSFCSAKGVGLIGDVPIFVAHQSADVWAHQDLFKLDADGRPSVVAGVPPDYFSKTGQLWGNPVFRWEILQRQNYGWWVERLRMSFRRFDVLRLDHFIGFVRAYEVPAGARTAQYGQYRPGPGRAFLEAVRQAFRNMPLIAEDLGAVTPEVLALRDEFGLPGMRILQFEVGGNREDMENRVGRYPTNCVVYTGTHDNDTTAGWYRKLPAKQRALLARSLGVSEKEIVWALIQVTLKSLANTAIIPVQDLLGLDSEARLNWPGVAKGNWRWRLAPEALTPAIAQRLRQLTKISNRRA